MVDRGAARKFSECSSAVSQKSGKTLEWTAFVSRIKFTNIYGSKSRAAFVQIIWQPCTKIWQNVKLMFICNFTRFLVC